MFSFMQMASALAGIWIKVVKELSHICVPSAFGHFVVVIESSGSPQKERISDATTEDHLDSEKMNEADDTSDLKGKGFLSVDYALCRFHWQNTLSIGAQQVFLIPSYSKEPIEITKDVTHELTQFYSKELQVPCGYHSGFLLVDGKKQDLEDIQVKNYMFEIDLYIRDDVIDKNHQPELITQERNLSSQQTKMERQWDEKRTSGIPTPTTKPHETEAITSKPVSVTHTSLIKVEQTPAQREARLNLSLDESRPVSNIDLSRFKSDAEVLPMEAGSSSVVDDVLGSKTEDVTRNKIDDVLGSKIDEMDKSVKQEVPTVYSSPKKGSNCSFGNQAENESIHSGEVTPQPSRSADSISISSCQSLLKDQNFENQLPFCRSLSSSLYQDIPLPLSFSSVSHTSSVDSVLAASQSLDQTLTPLQENLGNPQMSDVNYSEKSKFSDFASEERASSSVSLPARFSPSLQFKDFQAGQSMPSTITGGSCNSPAEAHHHSAPENSNAENKFGGSQPSLRPPLVTGRSRTLRHSTPTIPHSALESGTPIMARSYPSAKNLHQTMEINDTSTSSLPPKMADYIDSNQHLAGQLELLRGMNESLLAELVFLRQQNHTFTTASPSAPSPTPGSSQDSKDNLVSHLKEEKQTLQDEVHNLKEELRQYRHLAAYSQNTPLHSETPVLSSSHDKINIYHSEELVLRRRIADLQHNVSQLQESNLSLSAQLVGAQGRISQLETDNHKLTKQLQAKEKEAEIKKLPEKSSQPTEEDDNDKSRTNIEDAPSQTDTDSKSESVAGSSVSEKRRKISHHSRKPSRDLQSRKDHETTKTTEQEGSIKSTVNISQNSQPEPEEHQSHSKAYPIPKKSKKSTIENKSVMGSQGDVSQKQTSDTEDKTQTEVELVNNSPRVNDFSSPRKTRWDQYNQVRLNKDSIQNLQKSLDEQDLLRQAFLAQYKPKACDSSRASTENWSSYTRANSKDRTGLKSAKSTTIIPSTTSDSTSLLLAAPSLPQVWDQRHTYSTDQEFPCEDYSDTGTDVLLKAAPLNRNPPPSPERKDEAWGHRRRMSIDSIGSSTLTHSDFEMSGSSSTLAFMKKRSQSTEPRGPHLSDRPKEKTVTREALKTMNGTRYTDSPSSALDVDDAGKAKKVPYVSSNKKIISGSESGKRQWMYTHGMQPYIPRSSDDIHIGDVVKFSKQSGKISQGTVKFVGPLYGRRDIYIGIELQKEEGKHDGIFEGRRYYRCKPNKGVFVTFNKIVMAWEPFHLSSC